MKKSSPLQSNHSLLGSPKWENRMLCLHFISPSARVARADPIRRHYLFPIYLQLFFRLLSSSHPGAEMMMKNTVRLASDSDLTVPGKLLRLLFHDCFVEGCDASVLLQGNETERSDPANKSLGGFSVIDSVKSDRDLLPSNSFLC